MNHTRGSIGGKPARSGEGTHEDRPVRGRKSRLYEEVIARIKALIAAGTLGPGDKLPSEKELSESLGVSRTAIREAMSALQAQGVVEVRHGSGVTIKNLDQRDLVEPLALLLLTDQDDLGHLLELRRGIEGEAAYLAAKRATPTDLETLTAAFLAMENEVRSGGSGANHDYDFHYAVAKASQNPLFVKTLNTISDIFRRGLKQVRADSPINPAHSVAVLEQHRGIWKSIFERDGDAARAAMRSHVGNIAAVLVRTPSSNKAT